VGIALVWLRRDLRLADNPALSAALEAGHQPVLLFIHETGDEPWPAGAASRWWLHHSLASLRDALRRRGSDLLLRQGAAQDELPQLARRLGAVAVYWNRRYTAAAIARDSALRETLQDAGVEVHSENGSLLREPLRHLKTDGTPYRVFTPFWKALLPLVADAPPLREPTALAAPPGPALELSLPLESLGLLPRIPWDATFRDHWRPGEAGARARLQAFTADALAAYPAERDFPARPSTSRLSPHLHFGEISPRQVWYFVREQMALGAAVEGSGGSYLRQLAWREFGQHLLYHFPHTADQPLDPRFTAFPWRSDYTGDLVRWQRGETGIPIVDAGMRELWTTGWMHNRVRMITASLLTKNLLIPWQEGARWFWDTLVDADLANNTLGWQWTAGCGADAAPYFRIFNPVLQSTRFDAEGDYLRRWLPELAALPSRWIHAPWQAPSGVLCETGMTLGRDYPEPIVDLAGSRARALAAWERLKRNRAGVSGGV